MVNFQADLNNLRDYCVALSKELSNMLLQCEGRVLLYWFYPGQSQVWGGEATFCNDLVKRREINLIGHYSTAINRLYIFTDFSSIFRIKQRRDITF